MVGSDDGWGTPAAPLVPYVLRRAWKDELLLPDEALRLGATLLGWDMLGSRWASRISADAAVAEETVVAAVQRQLEEDPGVRQLPAFPSTWEEVDQTALPLRPVTRSMLVGLAITPVPLQELTVGELLDLQGACLSSVLDVCCAIEAAVGVKRVSSHDLDEEAPEDWAAEVACNDPRVRDLLGSGVARGMKVSLAEALVSGPWPVRQRLSTCLPLLDERLSSLASEDLATAAVTYLRALAPTLKGRRLEAIAARLGLAPDPALTLEAAGRIAGLTRARIDQLARKVKKAAASVRPCYMPQLDRVLEGLCGAIPASVEGVERHLREQQLIRQDWHLHGIEAVCRLCGREVPIERIGTVVVPAEWKVGLVEEVWQTAQRQVARSAASTLEDLTWELNAGLDRDLAVEQVEQIVARAPGFRRDGMWFWFDGRPLSGRILNIITKALSVRSPQTSRSLREALRRRLAFFRVTEVPPKKVLLQILSGDPVFEVEGEFVSSREPLDPSSVLSETELLMLRVLEEAPGHTLDRQSWMAGCHRLGLNMNTANVYTSYSPVFEQVAPGIWGPRGVAADPVQLRVLMESVGARDATAVHISEWTAGGKPRVAFELDAGSLASSVTSVGSVLRRVLAGRTFEAHTQRGASCGTIRVDARGTAWGFGPFIRQVAAEPGDVIEATFDLVSAEVVLRSVGLEDVTEAESR